MGLDLRPRTGRIANGSRLIVNGQPTTGSIVYQLTFNQKQSAPVDKNQDIVPTITPNPTLTPTNTSPITPTPSVTPTVTPTVTLNFYPTPTPSVDSFT